MGRATIKSGSINLLNTIIGAGILAMPYGLRANGIIFGSFLIAWSSLTSAFGLYLQNKVAKYTQQQNAVSYFSLCQLTYPQLSVVFDGAIAIKCFGVGVSYLVIIGDLMPKIMELLKVDEDSWWMERNLWITLFMVLMVAPLSYLKKLDSLKYTSVIALFSVVYLMCLVIEHYIVDDLPNRVIDVVGPKLLRLTLSSFPIFVFAYTCHQNMFAIINELEPSETSGSQTRQGNMIIRNAISVACASYLLVGIIGYLTFGNKVDANIITMYPKDSIPSLIGRLCIVVMVSLSFPLQCHPCRGSVNHIRYFIKNGVLSHKLRNSQVTNDGYAPLQSDGESMVDETFVSTTPMEGAQDTDGHDPIIVKLTTKQFYIITTGIVVLAYLVAISVKSLARVLAFVGSTGSTSISFILPGLFGYMLIKPLNGATTLTRLEKFCKYGGFALSVWGVIVMVVCLFVTIFLGSTH
ncbi:hypothetical protein C7M61_000983 [Candidozyma pseudohaemuli]|uniref:Amino acid transporter transmembrane domain-containing protein n=1 Tax=Candidozyma pseudohaemuli TaxID=418784 RepID=A0A2P7YZB8_9ASCO|nr:hypothetical protein C7M61_000983 [[Candida] pseudohaemulonii]PSK41302.1 hypothetical protein C7M61_000983 [[Candida] pseudohaemulonii]